MLYCNASIYTPEGYVYGGFRVEKGLFAEILPECRQGGFDLGGAKVIPGLVDIHSHGAVGADFSDGDAEGLRSGRGQGTPAQHQQKHKHDQTSHGTASEKNAPLERIGKGRRYSS